MERLASRTSAFSTFVWTVGGFLGLALILGGCSRGTYEASPGSVAQSYLPADREIEYHPDSLRHVEIVEEENAYRLELAQGYESLWRDWSVRRSGSTISARRDDRRDHRWFATLWSRDLSIASLQREIGLSELSKDQARERLEERQSEYDNVLQIDVYTYADASHPVETRLDRPTQEIVLRDGEGNEYTPKRMEMTVPSETYHPDRQVVYRRNTLFFERRVNDRDLLDDVRELRLTVRQSGSSARDFHFRWSFAFATDLASQ